MAKERVHFLQAVPAPALRASFNRTVRCEDIAELAHFLAQRRGFALFDETHSWLAALHGVNARPAGTLSGSPTPSPRVP